MRKFQIFIALLAISLTSLGEINRGVSYAEDLKYLLQINGTEASYQQSIKAVIEHFKKQDSNVPPEYWQKAEKEFLNTSIDDLIVLLTPIYQRNITHADLIAMIKFYESEAGKRISKNIPNITAESMQIGMQWGESIGKKIAAAIKNEGYKIRLPFAP
jgi:hypothetical protein